MQERPSGPMRLQCGRDHGIPPALRTAGRAIALPPRHASLRLPGDDLVDPRLGEEVDRAFPMLALDQGLCHHEAKVRLRFQIHGNHPNAAGIPAPDLDHLGVRTATEAIGQVGRLSDAHPQDRHGMATRGRGQCDL